jgi:hypothetical protein
MPADLIGIKWLAEFFNVPVEVMLVQNLIQSRVERIARRSAAGLLIGYFEGYTALEARRIP